MPGVIANQWRLDTVDLTALASAAVHFDIGVVGLNQPTTARAVNALAWHNPGQHEVVHNRYASNLRDLIAKVAKCRMAHSDVGFRRRVTAENAICVLTPPAERKSSGAAASCPHRHASTRMGHRRSIRNEEDIPGESWALENEDSTHSHAQWTVRPILRCVPFSVGPLASSAPYYRKRNAT